MTAGKEMGRGATTKAKSKRKIETTQKQMIN
jgi:hypothetical protein